MALCSVHEARASNIVGHEPLSESRCCGQKSPVAVLVGQGELGRQLVHTFAYSVRGVNIFDIQ